MTAASLLIAIFALVFTVGSFWWLNARRGRILCSSPHVFGMAATPQVFLLRLPLALYNTELELLSFVTSGAGFLRLDK